MITALLATGAHSAAHKAPPGWLPGIHFASALAFLLSGTAALTMLAPQLARAAFLDPRIAATTHLFTLGWITTSIMGALYQFLPVALDQPIRSKRVALLTFVLYVPGLVLFATSLGSVRQPLMLAGAAAFGTGVLLFVGNMAATLRRAHTRNVTWWALALATFFLLITLVLGLALAGNLRWGYLGSGRVRALGVHLHVALAGWVLLVMIGVAHRLLPMFLLTHDVNDRFVKLAVALVAGGAGMLAFLHHAPPLFSHWLPALAIALGCAAFLVQARSYFAGRVRPALDPGMRLAAGALTLLLAAMALAVPVIVTGAPLRVNVAYVTAVLLAISLFIAAHYYKIVPFLVWYHRFGPLAGKQPVPRVADLYAARTATVAGALLMLGATALVLSILAGAAHGARAAALLLAAGAATMCAQMFRLWRTHP